MARKKDGLGAASSGAPPAGAASAEVALNPVSAERVPEASASVRLSDEAAAISRKLTAAGLHADHSAVHEILVSMGALRAKLSTLVVSDSEAAAFVDKVKAIL